MNNEKEYNEITLDQDNCYKYPIELYEQPEWIALAQNGTILSLKKCKNRNQATYSVIYHFNIAGEIINYIKLTSNLEIRFIAFFEQQINMILDLNQGIFNKIGNYLLVKWNFKNNQNQLVQAVNFDKDIDIDQKLFFHFEDNVYCVIFLQYQLEEDKIFIRKMKVNFFKCSQKLQREPFSTLLINVQNDELFKNNSYDQIKFSKCQGSKNPMISILKNKTKQNLEEYFRIVTIEQDQNISFQTYKITFLPGKESSKTYLSLIKDVFISSQKNSAEIKDFRIGYSWILQKNHNNYKSYKVSKINQQKNPFEEENSLNKNEYVLKFKENPFQNRRIKITNDWNLVTSENDELFIEKPCYAPKSLDITSSKVFIGKNQIIISIKNKIDQYKIFLTSIMEDLINGCSEDLIQSVLQMLFFDERIWRN